MAEEITKYEPTETPPPNDSANEEIIDMSTLFVDLEKAESDELAMAVDRFGEYADSLKKEAKTKAYLELFRILSTKISDAKNKDRQAEKRFLAFLYAVFTKNPGLAKTLVEQMDQSTQERLFGMIERDIKNFALIRMSESLRIGKGWLTMMGRTPHVLLADDIEAAVKGSDTVNTLFAQREVLDQSLKLARALAPRIHDQTSTKLKELEDLISLSDDRIRALASHGEKHLQVLRHQNHDSFPPAEQTEHWWFSAPVDENSVDPIPQDNPVLKKIIDWFDGEWTQYITDHRRFREPVTPPRLPFTPEEYHKLMNDGSVGHILDYFEDEGIMSREQQDEINEYFDKLAT